MNNDSKDYKYLYNKYKQKYLQLKNSMSQQSGGFLESNDEEKPELMLFKAEWCGHCRNFKPSWDALQKHLTSVNFKTIDADEEEETLAKYGVEGFPTIMLKNKNSIIEFNGDRSIDNLVLFVNENIN